MRPFKPSTSLLLAACMLAVAVPAPASAAPADGAGHYADIHGLKLYYEIHGSGDGPPLVLLHGGGSTIGTSFGALLRELARTRRVIAFEQQGHGHTADVDRPFTFEQTADDTAALMAYLGVEKADFYGFSNGGSVALLMGIRYPKLVRRLIVASAMYRRDGLVPGFFDGMKHATLADMPEELKRAYLAVAPDPGALQRFHDKCRDRMLAFRDWKAEDLRAIRAPTLVMVGDADVIRPEHAVEMFRLIPHAQLAIVPGAQHDDVVHRAEVVLPIVERFLEGAEATGAPNN